MSRQSRLLAAAAARGKELHSAAARGGGRDRSGSGRRAAAAVSPVVAGHRRSFAGHRLCSANSLPAAGDGPGHRSQEREDDARARRRAAPTARHGAVPPPRVDGSRGRTARSPCLGTAAVPVLRRRLDPAAARGRPVTPPGDTAPAPSSARALSREPLSGPAPTRGALGRCPAGAFLPANTDLFQRLGMETNRGGRRHCESGTFVLSRPNPDSGRSLNKSALRNSNARYVPVKSKDTSAMNVQYSLKLIEKSGGSTHRKQVSLN